MARNRKSNAHAGHGSRVTIASLAQSLGLSKGTVSRALSGYPDISPKTKQRVRDAAQRLGYQPSAAATAIKSGKTRSAAFVMDSGWEEAHPAAVAHMVEGLSSGFLAAGWMLCVNSIRHNDDLSKINQVLLAGKRVDGLIIPRPAPKDPRVWIARENGLPFLTFGREPHSNNPYVDVDIEACVSCSVTELVSCGHREIAFIGFGIDEVDANNWTTAYRNQLKKNGLAERSDYTFPVVSDLGSVKELALELFASNTPPTAFLCSRDLAAVGVISAAMELGLVVGRQVSVVGFGGDPLCEKIVPHLASFRVDFHQIGQEIATQFIRCQEPGPGRAQTMIHEAKYIRGTTVGEQRARASS